MRRGANVADIQVNLVGKHERKAQSHDIAKRIRPAVTAIADRYKARVAIAEVPPGPPVLQTLVAEIYGPTEEARLKLAEAVKTIFKATPGRRGCRLVYRGRSAKSPLHHRQGKSRFARHQRRHDLADAQNRRGWRKRRFAASARREGRRQYSPRTAPQSAKTTPEELLALRVRSGDANGLPEPGSSSSPLVPLRELVKVEHVTVEKSLYHKNLMPVTYVIGDVAGIVESPVYAIFQMNEALKKLDTREFGGSGAELQDPQRLHALQRCRTRHEMGRRVAHHHRSLPRSRRSLSERVSS